MPEFAFLFRSTRTFDPETLAKRNDAARAWAIERRAAGIVTKAGPLEDGGFKVTASGVTAPDRDREVAAFLVVQAKDLDAAVELAKSHPGIGYGTEIEVRPLKPAASAPR
jgi:hypothetical protein